MAPGGWTPGDLYLTSVIEQARLNRLYESQLHQSAGIEPALGSPPDIATCGWYRHLDEEGLCRFGNTLVWSLIAGAGILTLYMVKK